MSGKYRKKRITKILKACSLALLLHSLSTMPCYAAIELAGETANYTSWGSGGPYEVKATSGSDPLYTTWALANQGKKIGQGKYNASITIDNGGIWRPLDRNSTINVYDLTMLSGSTIDLTYKYSAANGYTEANGYDPWSVATVGGSARTLNIHNGEFEGNINFLINLGTKNIDPSTGSIGASDVVILENPTVINQDLYPTVNVNIGYIMSKDFGAGLDSTFSWANQTAALLDGRVDGVFIISDSDTATMDKFVVTGDATNQVDGALNKYILSTELLQDSSSTTGKSYSVYWNAKRQGYLSQGAYSAANAALATRNLWRIEDGLFWKRGDDRRFANRSIDKDDFGQRESMWANTWRGKYTFDGIQNSAFNQTYSGIQVGYDKLRDGELLGGKLYTGLFFSKMTSSADFYAQNTGGADYNSGKGDLDSNALGAYMLWVGNKGHYLDTMVRWGTIDNTYTYTDSFGDSFKKEFTAKTYGIGTRYGLRIDKGNGWFMEPQVGLSYGVMRSYDFRLENDLRYQQDNMKMLIVRAGVSLGKRYGDGKYKGEAYLKLAANHDFLHGADATLAAMQPGADTVVASQKVDALASKDTWYDVTLGTNAKLSDTSDGWLELNKSFGGKVNTDWQINGGVAWHWGGPSKANKAVAVNAFAQSSLTTTTSEGAAIGKNESATAASAASAQPTNIAAVEKDNSNTNTTDNTTSDTEPIMASGTNSTGTTGALLQGNGDEYTFAPLVVETARPDWEKKLSPGTVSVIDVPKYNGEQKTLADMLQTVPGVYIDKLSGGGTGHYTTARVRGSSASEVNIYIDGVLVNTGSEQAVNLENINIDNVERIEVYRGYIPARFAGAAMGGAINIVTKKPDKTGGKVSYGVRSFGGQKFNLETTSPVGDGSLLLAVNREQAKGDFKYTRTEHEYNSVNSGGVSYRTDYPDTRWRQNNDYKNSNILAKWQDDNWFVKLNYIDNTTHKPQAVGSYLADVPEQYWPDYFNDVRRALRNSTVDTEKTELSFGRRQETGNVEWGWKLGIIHQDKQSLWARYHENTKDLAFGTNTFRNDTYNASVDGTWKMGESHLLEFLATASKETMKVRFDADQFYSSDWGKKFSQYFLPKYDMSNYYFQLQDTMKLDDAGSLTFTPLVRAQKSDIGIDVKEGEGWLYSYNLGLKKKFNSQWTVAATYGSYYKLPSWYEVFGDGVNLQSRWYQFNSAAAWSPETYAEHGKNWDVSINRTGKLFGTDNDTTLTYFHRDSKNLMTTVFNPLSGASWYANYGAGNIQGVELSSKMHWQRYDFTLSTTWQDSLITKGYTAYANMSSTAWQGQPFPWTPEWTVNARLDYRFPGDKLSVFGEYNWTDKLSWFNNAGTAAYYEPMGLFNIGMKYSFDKQFKLSAGINDVANKGPEQLMRYLQSNLVDKGNVSYPQQGRTYYMTVEYSF